MQPGVTLKGLTWDHPRACDGLFAETARFNALGTGVSVEWSVQSLRGFEATSIAQTAADHDLIILDHPFMGDAAAGGALVNLRDHLEPEEVATLRTSFVGQSFASYEYGDGLWALPIDAASQVAVCRPDLIKGRMPRTFDEVTALGENGGLGLSLANPHAFMTFLGIAACLGADISGTGARLIPEDIGLQALRILRKWARLVPEDSFGQSSIGLLEAMATSDTISYCPLVFSFNSYAQPPEAERYQLVYGDIPTASLQSSRRAPVLGGAGLAISAATRNLPAALSAALHFVGKAAQVRMAARGGQPAHKAVWSVSAPPTRNGSFFIDCGISQASAVLRPRWANYINLQNMAGALLLDDLLDQVDPPSRTLNALQDLFQSSKEPHPS